MTELYARIGGIATLAFVFFLFLAIKSKKKGLPNARKQFNIAWILVAVVVLMGILNQKPATQTAQTATVQETPKVEPVESKTTVEPIEKASTPVTTTKTEESTSIKETKVVKQQTPNIPGSIGMTPNEFRKTFDKYSSELGAGLTLSKVTISTGAVQDTFTHHFSDDLILIGSVNKADRSIREITLLTQAKTPASAENFLIAFGVIVLATNPDADPNAAKAVGEKLGIFKEGVDFSTLDTSTVYDGIEYTMKAYEGVGFMLFARDPDDKS